MTEFETMEQEIEIETKENEVAVAEVEVEEGWTRKEKLLCAAACTFGANILISIGSFIYSRVKIKKMLCELDCDENETEEDDK